jgi:hypothetical protein
MADRLHLSDQAVSEIVTACLIDFGLTNDAECVTRAKVRRDRAKVRRHVASRETGLEALFYDGRKDVTLEMINIDGRWHRRKIKAEHISLVSQPGNRYFDHLTVFDGTAETLAAALVVSIDQSESRSTLTVLGCDAANTNTGWKAGTNVLVQQALNRPIMWVVCQLHQNELPLRHLLQQLDGTTQGPKSFSGPIGRQAASCTEREIVAFQPIPLYGGTEIPDFDSALLSTDQAYLFEAWKALVSGDWSSALANRDPGTMCHSRWLTTASRIMRSYASDTHPSPEFVHITTFVVNVYCPTWFHIKMNDSLSEAAPNLFYQIKKSRYLPKSMRDTVDRVISANAYMAHPESLILAMIADDRREVRVEGYRKILKALERPKTAAPRVWKMPALRLEATDYTRFIQWSDNDLLVPPPLQKLSIDAVKVFIQKVPEPLRLQIPNHTQSVERTVKLVTEAAMHVCGHERRHGYICTTLLSRENRKLLA